MWCRGVVVITAAQIHSTKLELKFFAGSNLVRGVSDIRDGEDLWQWSRLEIRGQTPFVGQLYHKNNSSSSSSWIVLKAKYLSVELFVQLFIRSGISGMYNWAAASVSVYTYSMIVNTLRVFFSLLKTFLDYSALLSCQTWFSVSLDRVPSDWLPFNQMIHSLVFLRHVLRCWFKP